MTNWQEEFCAERPDELQVIGKSLYIQRRNIEEYDSTDENQPNHGWKCESREIGFDEYLLLKEIEEMDTSAAIDAYTEQLIEEGIL